MNGKMGIRITAALLMFMVLRGGIALDRGWGSSPPDPELDRMSKLIQRLDQIPNVEARRYSEVYFKLADRYLALGRRVEAMDALEKGLRVEAWHCRAQWRLAALEADAGFGERALFRLEFLNRHCREELAGELTMLEQHPAIRNARLTAPPRPSLPDHTLYLAPFRGADPLVMNAIASRVAQEFGIKTVVLPADLLPGEAKKRDVWQRTLSLLFDDLSANHPRELETTLLELGLPKSPPYPPTIQERVLKHLIKKQPGGEALWKGLEAESKGKVQYHVETLMAQLETRYGREVRAPKSLGVLGVVPDDIYGSDYNYLFGWAGERLGVMSYARFKESAPSVPAPRLLLLKRAVMQAFSSAGWIVGIPRCTTATCARAYPESLEEHDRKEDRLCHICLENLAKTYETIRSRR